MWAPGLSQCDLTDPEQSLSELSVHSQHPDSPSPLPLAGGQESKFTQRGASYGNSGLWSWEQGLSLEGRSRGAAVPRGVLTRTQGVSKAKPIKDCRAAPLPRGKGDGNQPGVLKPLCLKKINKT